jgi:hypothetical protein
MVMKKGRALKTQLGEMHEKGSKPKSKKGETPAGQKWWLMSDEQIPNALMSTLNHIKKNQASMEQETVILSRLYGGRMPGSAYGTPAAGPGRSLHPSVSGRLTYNVMAIVFDALVSKITKDDLSTQFVTNGGDYRQQRRAKKLSQFSDGINYETKMDKIGPDIFRDSMYAPFGVVHTFADWATKRVRSERVMPGELYIDYTDGFYGDPTQMHRVKMMDKDRLKAAFPEHAEAIEKCNDTGPLFVNNDQLLTDQVAVGESWHLPSGIDDNGEPTDDGCHAIYIANQVLTDEKEREWKKTRFPFSFDRWKEDTEGFHGIPLGRDLVGCQVEMNHLNLMFQRAFRMMAAFRIWVETGTVPDQHFQDKIGTILHGPKGSQPPQFLSPPALNQQYFQHRDSIKAQAFEIARISQLSAVGQKPAGLDSGEAQRVYHDIESEGFSLTQKRYEAFRLDVAEMQIDVVRDIFEQTKEYKLRAPVNSSTLPGYRFLRSMDWRAVRLEQDEYQIRGYSTSSLPSTPAGRFATIQDWMRAGLVDAETGRKLLNVPDLIQANSMLGAAEDWIMMCLDEIVENGKMRRPDPYMNLGMALKLGIQELSLGSANGMEEEKLDMLRGWIQEVDRLKNAAALAAATPNPALQGLPPGMGVGAPPPQSGMLPPPGTAVPGMAA